MQLHRFANNSEMVSLAAYHPEQQVLYLTYFSGPTTIAYQSINPDLFEELRSSAYPDVCVRFKIQAKHSFRRIDPLSPTG